MVDFLVLRLISRPAIFFKMSILPVLGLHRPFFRSDPDGWQALRAGSCQYRGCWSAQWHLGWSPIRIENDLKTENSCDGENCGVFFSVFLFEITVFLMCFKLLDGFNSIFIGEMLVFYIYVCVCVIFWGALFLFCSLAGFHLECTSNSLGATSLWPAGLPNAIKYFGVRYLLYVHCWQLVLCQS